MAMWNSINLGEWEAEAGRQARQDSRLLLQGHGHVDTEIHETAVKWIKDHAKDDKPFFMYLNFMKLHQPNFPSPELARASRLACIPTWIR